jgi:hypothetical protein
MYDEADDARQMRDRWVLKNPEAYSWSLVENVPGPSTLIHSRIDRASRIRRKVVALYSQYSDTQKRAERWLVVWSFDDVIFEPGAALSEQPIG